MFTNFITPARVAPILTSAPRQGNAQPLTIVGASTGALIIDPPGHIELSAGTQVGVWIRPDALAVLPAPPVE